MDTIDVGMDLNAAFAKDAYPSPYKFTGKIHTITIELKK